MTAPQRPAPRPERRTGTKAPTAGALGPGEPPARPQALHRQGVLTAGEIARIKRNLKLTPEQEPAWPRVEAALAEMGREQIEQIRLGREPQISLSAWPQSRLYAVAGPLLQTLRPDQKEVVRTVCRSLGFEAAAALL